MSGIFDEGTPEQARRVPPPGSQQRSRALIGTIIVLVVAGAVGAYVLNRWLDELGRDLTYRSNWAVVPLRGLLSALTRINARRAAMAQG